jgi:hypothetical protein
MLSSSTPRSTLNIESVRRGERIDPKREKERDKFEARDKTCQWWKKAGGIGWTNRVSF